MPNITEFPVYLKSNDPYNFRHGLENPKVIGLVWLVRDGEPRLCYKVQYKDGFIDYISFFSVQLGRWEISTDELSGEGENMQ